MIKKLAYRALSATSVIAMALAVLTVQNLCFFVFHQPDVPQSLKQYED